MQDNQEVVVAMSATLSLAPVGTTQPANEATALDAAFVDVGRTTDDGTQITVTPQWLKIYAHQSSKPVKQVKQREEVALAIVLMQFNQANVSAALGGGTVVPVTGHAGSFKYSPPGLSSEPMMAILDWIDDEGSLFRLVMPLTVATSPLTIPVNKTKEMQLAFNLEVQGADTGDDWYLLTNSPAWAPAA